MCRQVCTQGRVTHEEIHHARAIAMLLAGIERGARTYDQKTADVIFQCCQCGYCREWCVSSFDAPNFIRAARADIYLSHPELLPDAVKAALGAIKKNGQPYPADGVDAIATEKKSGSALLYLGAAARYLRPAYGRAAVSLLTKLNKDFFVLDDEPYSGFLYWNLGADDSFKQAAEACAAAVRASGAKVLVVASPEEYYLFTKVCPELFEGIGIAALPLWAGINAAELIGGGMAYNDNSWYARWCMLDVIGGETTSMPNSADPADGARKGSPLFWSGRKALAVGAELLVTYPDMARAIARSAAESALADGVKTLVVSGAEDAAVLEGQGIAVAELIELADKAMG